MHLQGFLDHLQGSYWKPGPAYEYPYTLNTVPTYAVEVWKGQAKEISGVPTFLEAYTSYFFYQRYPCIKAAGFH